MKLQDNKNKMKYVDSAQVTEHSNIYQLTVVLANVAGQPCKPTGYLEG